MLVTLALLGRVLLSVTASTLQKYVTRLHVSSSVVWRVTYGWMTVPAVIAIIVGVGKPVQKEFWWTAITAGVLDALGNLAMVAALRRSDLSVFGPLNGFRPVLALGFAWLLLDERPSGLGAAGVLVTVLGTALLLRDEEGGSNGRKWQMLWLRVTGLALSTFGAVFLKRAAVAGPTELTLGFWIICGLPVFWLWERIRSSGAAAATDGHRILLAHAVVFFAMQWLTLEVFRATLLAYSFAFFQLAMVLQVFIGRWMFKEKHFGWRLVCCAIIALGVALISIG